MGHCVRSWRWRDLEIHVGQRLGKDSRSTSLRRLMEGDPERPAAPLVWEPPWPGSSLRPFGAKQSIHSLCLWQFWECLEKQGYRLKTSSTSITRERQWVVGKRVVIDLFIVQANVLLKKERKARRVTVTGGGNIYWVKVRNKIVFVFFSFREGS